MLVVPLLRVEMGDSVVGEKKDVSPGSPGDSGPPVRTCNAGAYCPMGNCRGGTRIIGGPLSPVVDLDRKLVFESFRLIE